MKNSEIITTPAEILGSLDRQRQYCLKIAMQPQPCVCGFAVNQIDASGKSLDDFPVDNTNGVEFRCPQCKLKLIHIVPFMAPPHYRWKADETEINARLGVTARGA